MVLDSKAASPADQDTVLDFVCCISSNYPVLDCAADKTTLSDVTSSSIVYS